MLARPFYDNERIALKDFLRYLFIMRPLVFEISPIRICLVSMHSDSSLQWQGEDASTFAPFVSAAEAYVLSTWRASEQVIAAIETNERARPDPDFSLIPMSKR